MYNDLNTTEKLTVGRSKSHRHRFIYKIVNIETNRVLFTRHSNRKFVAATISGTFFGSLTQAADHEIKMKASGADVEGYYCYLADAAAFEPPKKENDGIGLGGAVLAYTLLT
jgi:hypothetical protein